MSRLSPLLLCLVFFVSGVAGLLFQTLWFRQAGLAFGNSVIAVSMVLTSFMLGLSIGCGVVARMGERIERPLVAYAVLEVGIAAAGIALVYGLPGLGALLAPALEPLLDTPWLLNPLRFAAGATLMLLPATAMGATLPLLVKALHQRDPHFGPVLGRLYAWNTFGAVVGSLAAEVWLLEVVGVRGSGWVAVGLDLAVAAAALWIAGAPRETPAAPVVAPEPHRPLTRRGGSLLAATFGAGFTLLALEVVWFRFLHLWVLSNSLSFSLVLAVVLSGIGLGSAAGGWLLRRDPGADRHAAGLAFLSGALTVALYAGLDWTAGPHAMSQIAGGWPVVRLALAVAFPVSFLSGALFPLTGAALHREIGLESRSAGLLTLANTLGSGLGSLATGLFLLPGLGMERCFFLFAGAYGVTGLLLWPAQGPDARPARRSQLAFGAMLALALVAFPHGRMEQDYFTRPLRHFGYPDRAQLVGPVQEGLVDTAAYLRTDIRGEPVFYRLVTSSFSMARSHEFARRYMKIFVYLPIALHPDPKDALLISYGIGSTA